VAARPEAVLESLDEHLRTLVDRGLIFHKEFRGEPHYGITSDGYRCHGINVSGISP
jgi:hypothetical protein